MGRPKKILPTAEIAQAQEEHEHYKKYDVFHARIQKENRYNPYTEGERVVITGWQLFELAQPHPAFIEEDIVLDFNSYVTNDAPVHKIYLPMGKYGIGNILSYVDYAEMMGLDTSKDLNILLNK